MQYPIPYAARWYKKDSLYVDLIFFPFYLRTSRRLLFLPILPHGFSGSRDNRNPERNKFHSSPLFSTTQDNRNRAPFGEFLFYSIYPTALSCDSKVPAPIPTKHNSDLLFRPILCL